MNIHSLLNNIDVDASSLDITITGISNNSEKVEPGNLFVAISGYASDGHKYILSAIEAGAKAIIGEQDVQALSVPYFKVANSRIALAQLAKTFYNSQSRPKTIIGITGTNGKTTTSFMIKHILEKSGRSCALFGSVHNIVNGIMISGTTKNTTIDALELQKQLAKSKDEFVIIEVTSHALTQHRVGGIDFDICLFTNLSQDHLDYHKTMESYFSAKETLFDQLSKNGIAIINTFNKWGAKLEARLKKRKLHTIYTMGDSSTSFSIKDIQYKDKMSLIVQDQNHHYQLTLSFLGEHNIYNAVMAFLTAKAINITPEDALQALETFSGVPGRFEVVQHPIGAKFIIDYAHTEDAFLHCFHTANAMGAKRIIHIFGFRGGRDIGKRQAMIDVSKSFSDVIILTFDDLNNLSYDEMLQTLYSFDIGEQGLVIPDRTEAIGHAWNMIEKGDWVFITGKGHERYTQSFHSDTFSDKDTVEQLLHNPLSYTKEHISIELPFS
ncbi:UDP-N-acetylmuramoyl-L-alanyl-D-glutamate--2,6-diaminopimelate ligase [Alkalicoccobacillus murimartini]|uniref:UDP-N-acetylmuramoyl-L-alanyl-D-glutamate--2, 6-diaminopimelate ligase n=1 Tax=Alkalicoccobacillus murimartini TaxID=171685 RepID=A0ABT9YLF8_9BACI|nr:UDP-N-acetylmuramoyl-L-alanyl-D-glutamate--2,6-diaminopimelate ligase [Alkalicoccobacillus murimartini]MDQ0208697.1 UDP-N-acetylmuramoyl-L-alanyl-D-glutamate--2,6-diaminopimelate ligase [Alkalicoccobacillus murimartini]